MRIPVLVALALVAGCSNEPTARNNAEVDINDAAADAQNSIASYAAAANRQSPGPSPSATPTAAVPNDNAPSAGSEPLAPPEPGRPGGLPDDRTPVSEASFTPDSAQGAADVVQTYYALIEAGKYAAAYRLWDPRAQQAPASARAFAASFGRFSEYHANVGAPGRIDAGAGQRFVTVPVQPYARLKESGAPFYQIGTVTLHRTADVDGASADQRRWRISAIEVKDVTKAAGRP
ncbi:hypothetical protein [Sphingomonas aracearum]|uniref:hypothetical protein n=1 Tax=Sphingomonas aracearum TaxID=2283317 RepID=UPI001EF0D535|nr:hypothetical protein [Sphingomonas aracearum]